jgi:uncharacterized cupredoxin-like copper-binding protein
VRSVPAALLLVLAASACAGKSATTVAITASDTACDVADEHLDAGKTTFAVKNTGSQVTEVYVYAPGDKVVTEKENIGPGTSARFTADLAAGDYEIACKPGQKGDGIRTEIEVHGEGGKKVESEYDREVEFEAVDYSFKELDGFTAKAGEKIEFKMENKGTLEHEFEVFGPDGKTALGEIGPTKAGKEAEVVLELATPGTYSYVCGIDDHEARGMKGTFTVTA